MKVMSYFLAGVGVFYAIVSIIYWFTSNEAGGTLMLLGGVGLGLLPGLYYLWWVHHMKLRPDDDPNAGIEEGAGHIDSFPASSIWPFVLGMGCFMATLTFVFGLWLAPVAIALILFAGIGGVAESRRGGTV